MDTTFLTNVLFLSLTVFLACLTISALLIVGYVIAVLKAMRQFFNTIHKESEKIAQDVEWVREKIKKGESAVLSFIVYLASMLGVGQKNTKDKKSSKDKQP